jgi:hypothetical protein
MVGILVHGDNKFYRPWSIARPRGSARTYSALVPHPDRIDNAASVRSMAYQPIPRDYFRAARDSSAIGGLRQWSNFPQQDFWTASNFRLNRISHMYENLSVLFSEAGRC